MKKRTIIILLILTLAIYASNIYVQSVVEENNYRPTSLELTPHDPISITSDSDFEVFPGTGTAETPYLIDGYNITTTSDEGIYINGTTKYFIVRNCYVDASLYGIYISNVADSTATVINNAFNNNDNKGIWLSYSSSSTVANNTCTNNDKGIYLYSSDSLTVNNNTCNNNNDGIKLYHSYSSTVTNNTCSNNNKGSGISLLYSGGSTVANNTCNNNNMAGIVLSFSGISNVINNTCNNNHIYGIQLFSSSSSKVSNNTFTNCGLCIGEDTIDAYISYTVENNWVNGKKLGFYTNLDSVTITEPVYGQLILVNCTNVTVRDQILNNASVGLFLRYCTSSVITNNTCNNNNYHGILLWYSDSSTVINNTCNNNYLDGISLSFSDSSTVTKNTCNNNQYGIELYYSESSTVANNTCNSNWYGICLASSDFFVFTYNLLQENRGYGIYLESGSDNNLIHHNTFVDNNLGGSYGGSSQAYDDGINNTWYDTETQEGNYWSDCSEIGSYSIDGSAGSVDLYPLDEPTEHTTTEHTTIESTTDENPLNFTFTLLMLVVPLVLTRIILKKTKK